MSWWTKAVGSQLPCYETIAGRDAAYPVPVLGQKVGMRRLCGNGYFEQMYNGTRWEVCPGESIVRDAGVGSAGYDITTTGTIYVPLAAYTIPAGLIGDGEVWEADIFAIFTTYTSGNSLPAVRLASNILTTQIMASAASRTVRNRGAFPRLGTTLQIRSNSPTDIYAGNITDASVNLDLDQTIDAGISPGAAGNVGRLRQWTFRRIG